MYCAKCGKEMPDEDGFCRSCGTKVVHANNESSQSAWSAAEPYHEESLPVDEPLLGEQSVTLNTNNEPNVQDNPSIIVNILAFLWPLLGLILYLVWKNQRPRSASSAGTAALASVALFIIFWVCVVFLGSAWVEKNFSIFCSQ